MKYLPVGKIEELTEGYRALRGNIIELTIDLDWL